MRYARYAVYWCPEQGGSLARAGAAWLGWDLFARRRVAAAGGARTERARRYGFHATLKAPFRLAEGASAQALGEALVALAAGLAPVEAPGLAVDTALGFAALRPSGPALGLDALAAACVTGLDRFRAPLTAAERAARVATGLDPAATARLDRWGYPHVLEGFRFHLTLSDATRPDDALLCRARAHFAPHLGPCLGVCGLSLVGDPGGGAGFHHLGTVALGGGCGALSPRAAESG